MTDPIALGALPLEMTLNLAEGADFACTLVSEDGPWPTAATIALQVGTASWTATIVGTEARFDVDKDRVAAAITAGATRFRLTCVDGTSDLVWGEGPIEISRRPA